MLGRVVVENGVKKIVPLTADCGSGNPVGTVIAVYSNKVPNGYLPCNGVAFDTAQFPVLYALLGDDHTPDLRECTLVGIGQSDRTMGAHDVYTVGQFKDDQLQNITGSQELRNLVLENSINASIATPTQEGSLKSSEITRSNYTLVRTNSTSGTLATKLEFDASLSARAGTTTHGKQVGVNWCIKATSGINENQADNVLSALSPVDVVALNNVHSVTSNAVAKALQYVYTFWIRDTRDDNFSPSYYLTNYKSHITAEFKFQNVVDNPFSTHQGFCTLITIVPWGDLSGGYPTQIAIDTSFGYGIRRRMANANMEWGSWGSL